MRHSRINKALAPSKDKWFDLNDLKIIAGAVATFVGGWLALIMICGVM